MVYRQTLNLNYPRFLERCSCSFRGRFYPRRSRADIIVENKRLARTEYHEEIGRRSLGREEDSRTLGQLPPQRAAILVAVDRMFALHDRGGKRNRKQSVREVQRQRRMIKDTTETTTRPRNHVVDWRILGFYYSSASENSLCALPPSQPRRGLARPLSYLTAWPLSLPPRLSLVRIPAFLGRARDRSLKTPMGWIICRGGDARLLYSTRRVTNSMSAPREFSRASVSRETTFPHILRDFYNCANRARDSFSRVRDNESWTCIWLSSVIVNKF